MKCARTTQKTTQKTINGYSKQLVPYGPESHDIQYIVSRTLSSAEEKDLYDKVTKEKAEIVVIISDYALADYVRFNTMGKTILYRSYYKNLYNLAEGQKHVYLSGANRASIPAQSPTGFVHYACVVIILERNGLYYTVRVNKNNQLTHISLNTINNYVKKNDYEEKHQRHIYNDGTIDYSTQPDILIKNAKKQYNIDLSNAKFTLIGNIQHNGSNRTIDTSYIIDYNYYCCLLQGSATDSFNVDDTIVINKDTYVVPALYNKSIMKIASTMPATEYIAACALVYYGYSPEYLRFDYDLKYNLGNEQVDITLYHLSRDIYKNGNKLVINITRDETH